MTTKSYGLATAPMQVSYDELLRVWREADDVGEIDHMWLFDHLLPIGGDPLGPIFEGWTMLSALAAQTRRVQVGLLVTSNRFRPPAMLAKIAATTDVVAGGRMVFGIGAGSRPGHPIARREYAAHGLPFHSQAVAMDALDEALTVIRRLWTETEPFDFAGEHVDVVGAFCNPKPLRRTPVIIGGRTDRLLRIVAEHGDIWNIPGGDLDDAIARSARLDDYCAERGRDPAEVTRSMHLRVSYDDPASTRGEIEAAHAAGFTHITLGLAPPYPDGVARWVADEVLPPRAT
jgi:alkanesulfonate monooxygenase SsuD/methylene tetrahydromethanopterin reductase-like flavin-dependent oxidoreductase (luciferase family)